MRKLSACLLMASIFLPLSMLKAETNLEPLPGFYPEKIAVKPYDPDKYVKSRNASVNFRGANVSEKNFEQEIPLNGDWKFSGTEKSDTPFPADADLGKGLEGASFDDSAWADIKVPSNFYTKYPADLKKPYVKAWYRKTVDVPASAEAKRVFLHFGVLAYDALLFVNGKKVGSHHGDFTPWDIDITDYVKAGTKASLAIRVFSDLGPSGAVGADKIIKTASHPYGSQYAASNIKGGIWQAASMKIVEPLYISQCFINPDTEKSQITVDCVIVNSRKSEQKIDLHTQVSDALASNPSKSPSPLQKTSSLLLKSGENKVSFTLPLSNPRYWSPDEPNLYNLSMLLDGGTKLQSIKSARFGYRSFKANGDHFLLNGKRIYLFGESIIVTSSLANGRPEQDQPDVNMEAHKFLGDKLLGFKSRGSNALRLSEQPAVPEFLDIADEVGILIYNMWAWSYNNKLDPSFEKTNREELTEWLSRDYNHASVVMWLGGNEVKCNEELAAIFGRQTDFIRAFDKSGRPVSVFSGAAYGYAQSIKLNTDVLDLHSYLGLSEHQWTFWKREFNRVYDYEQNIYAPGAKKIPMPFIIWELVGFSWGQRSAVLNQDTVTDYMKWAKGPTNWSNPNGIGWAGTIGLAAALDKNRGGKYGMDKIGRRIMEYVRQDTRVCGYAPWFLEASIGLPSTNIWTQPVFCGMRGGKYSIPLRNPLGGSSHTQEFFVVNSSGSAYAKAAMRISLAESDGTESLIAEIPFSIAPWGTASLEKTFDIPAKNEARWAQIRLRILADGREISRNYYDIYVQNKKILDTPLKSLSAAALLSCGADRENEFSSILRKLGVSVSTVTKAEDLKSVKQLFIAPSKRILEIEPSLVSAVRDWIKDGGSLLVMEQEWAGEMPLISRNFRNTPCLLADLALPKHPVFKELSQFNFEFWDNPEYGLTASYVCDPFSYNIVAVRAPRLGDSESYAVLSEGKSGKGRIISSQFSATALWGIDSAASLYLRNLLEYSGSPVPENLIPWSVQESEADLSGKAELSFIDLKPYANMGFADEVEGDGKGGWTDQGKNDFRMMPLGKQILKKVPYEIINPAENSGRSCIAVSCEAKGNIVPSVKGIKVGAAFARLFFLHTEAFVPGLLTPVLTYRINYEDNSSLDVVVKDTYSIGDWWRAGNLPEARVAFARENPLGREVAIFTMEWNNPRPDVPIRSIDMIADKGSSICLLVAITGEKGGVKPWSLCNDSWTKLADGGANDVSRSGPMIPTVEAMEGKAFRIKMPARNSDEPRPVVFTRFDKNIKNPESYRYLVMEVKSETAGLLEFAIPDSTWKEAMRCVVKMQKDEDWRFIRISLDKGLGLQDKKWGLDDLRGEFYIFSGATKSQPCSAMDFCIRNIHFE